MSAASVTRMVLVSNVMLRSPSSDTQNVFVLMSLVSHCLPVLFCFNTLGSLMATWEQLTGLLAQHVDNAINFCHTVMSTAQVRDVFNEAEVGPEFSVFWSVQPDCAFKVIGHMLGCGCLRHFRDDVRPRSEMWLTLKRNRVRKQV